MSFLWKRKNKKSKENENSNNNNSSTKKKSGLNFSLKNKQENGSSNKYLNKSSSKSHKSKGNRSSSKLSTKFFKRGTSKKRVLIEVAVKNALKDSGKYTKSDMLVHQLPLIRNVQNETKRRQIIIKKLRLCSVLYDFMDQNKDAEGIERKRQMLVEIVEYISTAKWWNNEIADELVKCMKHNFFRSLPLNKKRHLAVKGDEEEEVFQDPQWLHLQLVYDLCLRFLITNDIDKKIMQKHLSGNFIANLIKLFESEDSRERDYLKTILHRIYGRFMPIRQDIRKYIGNEIYRYSYTNTRSGRGIAEFLDIFSSIINGFQIPVKNEHRLFLKNVLMPLHKGVDYEIYFQQLADCCVLFVNKDQLVSNIILQGLLRYWPYLSPTKQAFFLREMLSVIGALIEHEKGFKYENYINIILLSTDRMLQCITSQHFQVADTALTLWKDSVMIYLAKQERDIIFRKLFCIIKCNTKNHWNTTIQQTSLEIQEFYRNVDENYWNSLEIEYNNNNNNKNNKNNKNSNHKSNGIIENSINLKYKDFTPHTLTPKKCVCLHQEEEDKRYIKSRTIKNKLRKERWDLIRKKAEQKQFIKNKE